MQGLQLTSLGKRFDGEAVLSGVTLDIRPGEIVALTGPSGAGKTTTCRLITGLEIPDEGHIDLNGSQLTTLPTHHRRVAHMFESYALYPNLNVAQNVSFPLTSPVRRGQYKRDEIEARVAELLEMTEMAHLRARLPSELSGGQKQRVALCRALVQDASIYLLDEPISHLDAKLRNALRGLIRRRQTKKDAPTLWATPDAMEALSIADRVAVLIDGKVEQFAEPEEIYYRPATTAVARLVGDPAMNLFAGTVSQEGDGLRFDSPGLSLTLPEDAARRVASANSRSLTLGIRPNAMDILGHEPQGAAVSMQVYAWEPFGKYSLVTARVADNLIRIKTDHVHPYLANDTISVAVDAERLVLFDSESQRAL
ncbi:sn-glycerol-3-phosphate import ATP-binding protein UgpC [Hartmannibacter diazotrophicus]|uniref:sn-glycerol-3-phosphate import ATP-binding protein UgpC n=1 Tax=Hartmannibacter diazotrophicus TaxID=1482074 RepID=A0A2C9D7F5_9HYPH|nr:ABC transporter ATP-binding protein [Hartmannibacter diazotrophicus]SON55681.1 sn-glycerol-3-phosphate import ATP-binding protein UgpC [Hartmannibacter diazotrophicus]